jgi:hypothetical protein
MVRRVGVSVGVCNEQSKLYSSFKVTDKMRIKSGMYKQQ